MKSVTKGLFSGPVRSRSYVTLDGLRGLAALSVVVLHSYRFIGDMAWSSAALAVDLFFALSGFVLAHAYSQRLAEDLSVGEFMKARFIRLYPLYLVGIALASRRCSSSQRSSGWARRSSREDGWESPATSSARHPTPSMRPTSVYIL